jgi:hypothetical protein
MSSSRLRATLLFAVTASLILTACSRPARLPEVVTGNFVVKDFNPISNWNTDTTGQAVKDQNHGRMILLDYTDALEQGFFIPTARQTPDGFFELLFHLKNTSGKPLKFFYKIYYQNESYKFPEKDPADSTKINPLCQENFYGSWEEEGTTFKEAGEIPADGEFHPVTGKFRIAGNPRNDQRYFSNGANDRWKRNPRVGEYSFLLVVTTEENIRGKAIPEYIGNIGLRYNGMFVNPYYYFLYGEGAGLTNTVVSLFPYRLKVIAKPDPGAGIYINPDVFNKETYGKFFTARCGQAPELAKKAQFQQFIHYIDPTTKYYNIPVIADVLGDNYSLLDYNWNKAFYTKDELIAVTASTTKRPCETTISDPLNHKITIKNPGTEFGKWEKQNVGVITRHGFTYGKWTVKAKMSELLNRNNMWNGLTNAIWLITQNQAAWNYRRDCNNAGYMENYYGGQQDKRVKNVGYSEIDFEILKTIPYCPGYVLPPAYNHAIADQHNVRDWNIPLPEEVVALGGDIEVACTNWDMACWDPVNFNSGCNPVVYQDQVFWAHRWDRNYRAITTKVPEPDDELFAGPYYYFQIDWEPDQIIWRIGPSKDKLRVVGYVNSTITCIPDNQMLLIVSQEFHNTRWWVGSMYAQDNIPFPKDDLVGEIFEVTIE